MSLQLPPPELELLLDEVLLVLLLDEELELLEDELELLDELLLDELELLELLDDDEPPLIAPVEAVSVTRSRREPSSRRTSRSVCEPAARLLNVARFSVEYPLVCVLFCVVHAPESIL
jgi:hypothetical protein